MSVRTESCRRPEGWCFDRSASGQYITLSGRMQGIWFLWLVLVCKWPNSVGKNHFFVNMLFNRDSTIQKCFQKILHSLQVRKFSSLSAVWTTCHTFWTSICPKHQPSGRSPVSRSFELLQHASIRTFQQHVLTTLSVRQASGFLSKA